MLAKPEIDLQPSGIGLGRVIPDRVERANGPAISVVLVVVAIGEIVDPPKAGESAEHTGHYVHTGVVESISITGTESCPRGHAPVVVHQLIFHQVIQGETLD